MPPIVTIFLSLLSFSFNFIYSGVTAFSTKKDGDDFIYFLICFNSLFEHATITTLFPLL